MTINTNKKEQGVSLKTITKAYQPDHYFYFYTYELADEQTEKEVDFLIKELAIQNKTAVLDLACGHGRHTNRLAKTGCKITGLDMSKDFLKQARKEARKNKVAVNYILADMRKITYREVFDKILLLFTSFGYDNEADSLKLLKRIANALKPKGLLCLDLRNKDNLVQGLPKYTVIEKDKGFMQDHLSINLVNSRLHIKRKYCVNNKVTPVNFSFRVYSYPEIKETLKQAGFMVKSVYGNWDGDALTIDSKRMIIIAQKI